MVTVVQMTLEPYSNSGADYTWAIW